METELKGRVALVTGGSQGLGRAICDVLAEAGVRVAVADIKEEQAQHAAGELGEEAMAVRLDVGDEASVDAAIAAVRERYGRIDILVNNAGTDVTKAIAELTPEEWDRVQRVNLRGPFLLTRAIFPIMHEQGGGHIVNVASTAAKRAWTEAAAYHASKWGVLGFSHAAHAEGRTVGIKVTAVVAGGMKTPFILDRFPEAEPNLQDPRNVARTVRFVLTLPGESVIPEVMVLPMRETSWP